MNLDNLQDNTLDISTVENMPMIQLISLLMKEVGKNGMDGIDCEANRLYLNALARRQGLSVKKMFIIAVMANFYVTCGATMEEITEFCKCDNLSFVELLPEINQLLADGYIIGKKSFSDEVTYIIDEDLMNAYSDNRPYKPKDYKCVDKAQLLFEYDALVDKLTWNKISYEVFCFRFNHLIESNRHLQIIQTLEAMELREDYSKMIVLYLCSQMVTSNVNNVWPGSGAKNLFSARECDQNACVYHFQCGRGELFEKGIIEHGCVNGMRDRECVCLTRKTAKALLGTVKTTAKEGTSDSVTLVAHKSIAEKHLFYDKQVEQQVSRLGDLLSNANFRSIQSRLKAKGMRTGFTCIFYGSPGTGKTETALQLARATGRDIMQVNISQIRSMWVGESEKNIQALFDDYRQQVRSRKRCPILLFNEADAIFNQRNERSKRSVDKMENSIQNIILQEMEKLEGILIATTNLQGNLDKAFERRFLYKVKFTRPSLEARANIWRSLMPGLDRTTARQLAHDYDLSGGQIENVARKSMVDEILYGKPANVSVSLRQYCDDERMDKSGRRPIGFTA